MIVLKRPIITEKTIKLYQDENKVTFEVALSANKFSAVKALEDTFDVTVLKAWTHTRLGKVKTDRVKRRSTRLAGKKIMVFKLKAGNKIDYFES